MSVFHQVPLLLSDEGKLAEFVASLPFSAYVQNLGTDRFILSNEFQAKNWGMASKDVIGAKPSALIRHEKAALSRFVSPILLERDYEVYRKANYLAQEEGKALSFKESSISFDRTVYVGNCFKWPILNQNGKATAIFSISIDTTRQTDLLKLYSCYKQYLPKKMAISQLLRYLKLNDFFYQNPTDSELIVLLTMRTTSVYKLIAQRLNVQLVTATTHVQRLRGKLKGIELERVIMHLREFHYEEETFTCLEKIT